ncbi:MAG TPA: ABC transporter permease [Thermomicrobiales bacterium]|nr:ABC transporter permease [Thermomicrobiales bacterium]
MSAETATTTQAPATTLPPGGEPRVPPGGALTTAERLPQQNQLRRNLRRFLIGNRLNLIGVIIVVMFFVLSLFGQIFAPYDPYAQDITGSKLLPPSTAHLMGTDELGRDVFSRVLTGTRISLQVAVVVLSFAVTFGTLVGSISGYFGGIVDELLMRFTDMFLAFPALILAIAIAASLGRELKWTMVALSTVFWPWYARLVRAQILSIRERDFVTAGESIGLSGSRLLFRHILPNAISVVIIQLTLDIGYAILATSSLSFIGLGAQPPSPEWGTMMATARNYFREAWWYISFPGIALTLTVFAFNVLGDGLQDALDPRSSRR